MGSLYEAKKQHQIFNYKGVVPLGQLPFYIELKLIKMARDGFAINHKREIQ